MVNSTPSAQPLFSHDTAAADTAAADAPEQLALAALMPAREFPLQFRLDRQTRQRGLAHIAAIRAQLSAAAHTRQAA